jgi:hypothetical protein
MEQPQAHKLPTSLAGVLNGPEDHRDSAYYSIGEASKREENYDHTAFRAISDSSVNR